MTRWLRGKGRRGRKTPEKACKPGPVGWTLAQPDGHFSRTPVTRRLTRPYPRAPRGPRFTHAPGVRPTPGSRAYLTLLRVGFTEPARSPAPLVSSYLTVSPLPLGLRRSAVSFLWHSAVGSPPLAVSQHPALRSPDFPPARVTPRRRPSGLLWCQSKSASLREKVSHRRAMRRGRMRGRVRRIGPSRRSETWERRAVRSRRLR